jgi:hypothetical protein
MMPLVNTTSSFITPPPLVNTTTPGTTIAHVPYDNIAPSVSSAQVDNNARGNSTPTASPAPAAAPAQPDPDVPSSFSLALTNASGNFSTAAPATFLAQLMGQDLSPEAKAVLVQYEKLVNIGNVKYKPSNALKPEAEPSNIFGKILQSERAAPSRPAQETAPSPLLVAQTSATQTSSVAASASINELQQLQRQAKAPSPVAEPDLLDTPTVAASLQAQPTPRIIHAYVATASRLGNEDGIDATAELA